MTPNSPELTQRLTDDQRLAKKILSDGVHHCIMDIAEPLFQRRGYRVKPCVYTKHGIGLQQWCNVVLERVDDPQFCFSIYINLANLDSFSCSRGVFGKPRGGDCRVNGNFTGFFDAIDTRYQRWVKVGRPINVVYD